MAVSERGGKNNSGDYEHVLNQDGHLVEDAYGQPKIDQDLVNYDLTAADLAAAVAGAAAAAVWLRVASSRKDRHDC